MVEQCDIEYELIATREEFPSLLVKAWGKVQALHSRMHPSREARSMADQLAPGSFDTCIVLGVGLGYHLMPLGELARAYKTIILIDVLPRLKETIASSGVNSFLLSYDNIRIIDGKPVGQVRDELLSLIDLEEARGIKVLEHSASLRIFHDYYSAVREEISAIIDRKAGNIATRRAFGRLYVRNSIRNLSVLHKQKPVSALFGRYGSMPAVVVTPGPSLELSIETIAAASDRLFIIAVDSALPLCRAFGINPDFVISVDPQAYICEHFLGVGEGPVRVVTSLSAYPWHIRSEEGQWDIYCSLNSHPFAQVIEERWPGLMGSVDSRTGSVAGDALMLAGKCGFGAVACAGFDFGFSDFLTYSRGTAYQRRYAGIFQGRLLPAETSNFGYVMKSSGALKTDGRFTRRSFLQYRQSLEGAIAGTEGLFHINPPGSPLKGTEPLSMEAFVERFCRREVDRESLLERAQAAAKNAGEVMDIPELLGIIQRPEFFEEIMRHSLADEDMEAARSRYRVLMRKIFKNIKQ